MAYADLATIQNTDPGDILTAAWCDQVRDNGEFFVDPPTCSVSGSSTQNVENDEPTVLTAATENFDNDSMHSTSSNTSRVTIQTPGRYLFLATVRFDNNSNPGIRRVSLLVNGTTTIGGMQVAGVTNQPVRIQATRSFVLDEGEYVEALAYQTSTQDLMTVNLDELFAMFLTR